MTAIRAYLKGQEVEERRREVKFIIMYLCMYIPVLNQLLDHLCRCSIIPLFAFLLLDMLLDEASKVELLRSQFEERIRNLS